jgi:hypothetical protein
MPGLPTCIDIVATSVGAPDISKIGLGGSIGSTLASNANVFTQINSSSLNFGDSWRFRMHITGDVDTPWTLHTTPDDYSAIEGGIPASL